MAQPYIGEIRMFAGSYAPVGWMFCNGSLLSISENEELFSIIGTTYGGDGQTTFALPDLRGRVPVHQGNGFILGEKGGTEEITLTVNQIPAHTHAMMATSSMANSPNPANALIGTSTQVSMYFAGTANSNMNATAIIEKGGSQPHSNIQPSLAIGFIISLFGIYPSPNY